MDSQAANELFPQYPRRHRHGDRPRHHPAAHRHRLKRPARWSHDCADYLIQVPLGLGLCLLASLYAHKGLQFAMALLHIAYRLCWTARVVTAPL
ncbi:hypothetical protein [Bosea lupini]|uniref:hypothetical protein n=1 Tax=Bosea lupini TaxID=1036779 RepID=UPI000B83D808|nr:hypothetical protein [Bosea lupini]